MHSARMIDRLHWLGRAGGLSIWKHRGGETGYLPVKATLRFAPCPRLVNILDIEGCPTPRV